MSKLLNLIIAGTIAFALGLWAMNWYHKKTAANVKEQSTVLLEKIKKVSKLITIEGYFTEIYDHKDYYYYDISPFRKKALLRVKAKVSVGYDLGNMKIDALPDEKKIVISQLPEPEILSIDHEVDFYDLQQGVLNSFSASDYTALNRKAKQYIEKTALESELLTTAKQQANTTLELIEFIVENAGWTVEIEQKRMIEVPMSTD